MNILSEALLQVAAKAEEDNSLMLLSKDKSYVSQAKGKKGDERGRRVVAN